MYALADLCQHAQCVLGRERLSRRLARLLDVRCATAKVRFSHLGLGCDSIAPFFLAIFFDMW